MSKENNMFKRLSVKRFIKKIRPALEKKYGVQESYSVSQIRTVVFTKNFNIKHLPLAYILCLSKNDIRAVLDEEYPELCLSSFEHYICELTNSTEVEQHFIMLKA